MDKPPESGANAGLNLPLPEQQHPALPCRLSDPDLAAHHIAFISKQQESFAGPLAPALYIRFECGAIRDNFKNVAARHLVCL
jgi:hypothetical protein